MPPSYPADIIAAIATAPGEGAIAVVRLSGPDSYAIADRFFRCTPPPPSQRPAGTFLHGQAVEPHTGEILDDALLLLFRAPHSYTGEDSVEFQCHGGPQTVRRLLQGLLRAGARQAEPGEFTKRAFLNGKIDLTQAEAVLDLIHARTERAARLATAQLEDALGRRIRALYDELLVLCADLESMLDFPDDELPQSVPDDLSRRLAHIADGLRALLATWQEGHLQRDGARIVIAGAPNVGKSTLLNLLAGRNRAIVSPHPGTTRDTIEEFIILGGLPVHLVDTAGLRDAPCEVEQEGIRRTRHAVAQADLCICVVDASQDLSANESAFIAAHNPQKRLVVLNKTDLGQKIHPDSLPGVDSISISLKSNPSASVLAEPIVQKLLHHSPEAGQDNVAISERHRNALQIALEEISNAIQALSSGLEIDFLPAATHARAALDPIGSVFGKNCSEEMIESIFSRFCVGK